jgi:hypothetical protein
MLGSVLGVVLGTLNFAFLSLVNVGKKRRTIGCARYIFTARGLPKHAHAVTYGSSIFVRDSFDVVDVHVLMHELIHVEQFRRWGWFGMLSRYGADIMQNGYADSYIEQEARGA